MSTPSILSLSQSYLHEFYDYDPATGEMRIARHIPHSRTAVGAMVGQHLDQDGYHQVKMRRRTLLLHRVVWTYMTGEEPPPIIDHINRVKTDNRWENLRAATNTLNQENQGLRSTNTSGFKGSHFNAKSGKWHATIRIDGSKRFIGAYPTAHEAAIVYAVAAHMTQPDNPDGMDLPGETARNAIRRYLGRYLPDGTATRI